MTWRVICCGEAATEEALEEERERLRICLLWHENAANDGGGPMVLPIVKASEASQAVE